MASVGAGSNRDKCARPPPPVIEYRIGKMEKHQEQPSMRPVK
jgi:hypothetical protein